ncbi:Uncharacterized membrane protein [Lachnospiraceae bacterium]|nr:Uncharacterized membrane protein [Lachnospiraceae bacterium]
MAERICKNCGAPIDAGATECRYCRTPVGSTPDMVNNSYSQGNAFNGAKSDEEEHKIHAILAYLGILVLVPILAAKDSPFARFHANQGLILLIVNIASTVIFSMLPSMFSIARTGISIGTFVLMIMGIINAANLRTQKLPVIGDITILK